jgi:TolB-like protein
MSLISELRRRNVLRAAAAYVALAWLVIQVVETLFPLFGFSDAAARTVVIVLAVGFVPSVIAAWAFELTPEGLKRESEVDHDSPAIRSNTRRLDRMIMLFLALGLAYFAFDKFVITPSRQAELLATTAEQARQEGRTEAIVESYGDNSIAVLPFVNMSADPEQEYFADGISEELLNLLARIPELRVISRTSAFAFKGKDVGIAEIAGQLKVSHVLEGSVRQAGNRLRITAQLIDARTDSHLWSETYDRTLEDIFDIQDEIAARVVAQLRVTLLGEAPKVRRANPQAYLLAMQARQMLSSWDVDEAKIHDLLQQAIALDPDYADAWVDLMRLYQTGSLISPAQREKSEFFRTASPEEWDRRADEALDRALAIEPDNARAIAFGADRGLPSKVSAADFQKVARDYERALALDPNDPDVLRRAGTFASTIGRFDVGIRLGEFSVARDPLCLLCVYWLGQTYMNAGRLDDAEPLVRSFVDPKRGGQYTLGVLLLLKGEPEQALIEFDRIEAENLQPWKLAGHALALHAMGRVAESDAALAELESTAGERVPHLPAEVYAWTGRPEQAWPWLERVEQPRYIDPWSPLLQPLARDPRWEAYWAAFGTSLEEVAAIEFDPVLPGADQKR